MKAEKFKNLNNFLNKTNFYFKSTIIFGLHKTMAVYETFHFLRNL